MKRKINITAVAFLAWVGILISVPVWADEEEGDFLRLKGALTETGYVLDLTPNSISTHAILVRSLPSHSLLLAVMDESFLQTEDGRILNQSIQAQRPWAFVQTRLPEGRPTIVIPPPPMELDDTIQITIYGELPDMSPLQGFVLSEGRVNIEAFDFESSVDFEPGGGFERKPPGPKPCKKCKYKHCVTCSGCGTICTTCATPKFYANCAKCCIVCGDGPC